MRWPSAKLAFMVADFPSALQLGEASKALANRIALIEGPERLVSLRFTQRFLRACVASMQGDHAAGRVMSEPLLAEQHAADVPGSSYVLDFLGQIEMAEGNLDAAGPYLHEALAEDESLEC